MTLYVLKVTSRITMNKPNEETAMVMNLLIVRVNFIKLVIEICSRIRIIKMTLCPMRVIMEIHSRIKMILTTLFVLKVSWMTMMKMSGGMVMIMSLSIVKVNLMKHIMEILNTFKIGGTKVFLFIC